MNNENLRNVVDGGEPQGNQISSIQPDVKRPTTTKRPASEKRHLPTLVYIQSLPRPPQSPMPPLPMPPLGQLPTVGAFQVLLNGYLNSLTERRRTKALITTAQYKAIQAVLRNPKCTTIETAHFRSWAKSTFVLEASANGRSEVVRTRTRLGKPVAVKEDLFFILTTAHIRSRHGGRNKTAEYVNKYHAWVPRGLVARFVKSCPGCPMNRGKPIRWVPGTLPLPTVEKPSPAAVEFGSATAGYKPAHGLAEPADKDQQLQTPQLLHKLAPFLLS
ncbi:hypothetical protein FN846DRAFT_921116 [Sphaerosporella brunnea]|uniref:Integrase zinc-binding domain-containing protein n=1 Tax=Sphaerosporella brunnea TaxID=1250544 RepID=A0A5J5EPV1_9PEZI|nr:hypothetical protein FN846DRAFT_921116 [Sphaerosporella brunnea]